MLAGGAALCAVALATALGFVWFEAQQIEQRALDQTDLQARILQDHADRTLDTTQAALQALADGMGATPTGSDRLNQRLADLQRSLRFVRSLSLVDGSGRVLASANAANLGAHVDLAALHPGISPVGPLQTGRDLADQDPAGVSRRHYIPYVHALSPGGRGAAHWLVATLNPDFFANAYELTLDDDRLAAALVTYDGQILAATRSVPRAPGDQATTLAVFQRYLPRVEHGRYVAPGLNGERAVTAFRSARTAPWVLVVEAPYRLVVDAVLRVGRGVALVLLFVWGAITGLTFLAWRSVRAHAAASADLQHAHERVAQRETELRQLIESVQELMFRTDPTGHITFVNHHWRALMGLAEAPALGQSFAELVDAGHQDQALALFEQARQIGRTAAVQLRLSACAGHRLVEVALTSLPDGGYAGFAIDVTEREAANHAKAEFLANITHELRTPLQAILGFSELGVVRGGDSPALHTMFRRIHQAGGRMLGLVNNLLDLTRVDQAGGGLAAPCVRVQATVETVLTELQPLAAARQITLQWQPASDELSAPIDPAGLQQVLSNVVANAIRFAPSGSPIALSAQYTPEASLQLTVHDRGPGIPTAELERIFEPFVQSSRTKDGSGGTGLGLAICRRIMRLHGGTIRAANHPDGGAVFTLSFPSAAADEAELSPS